MTTQRLLSVRELCERLGVSRDWVYDRTRRGCLDPLPVIRFGRLLRFDEEQVQQYIAIRQALSGGGNLSVTEQRSQAMERRSKIMARKRFQEGGLRLRGKKDKYWEGSYYEDVINSDETISRQRRWVSLGKQASVPTRALARRRLRMIVDNLNDPDCRPKRESSLKEFIDKNYMHLYLSTLKRSTQDGHKFVIGKYILPVLGTHMLEQITREMLQGAVNRKHKEGKSWNTVRLMKMVLCSIFSRAVEDGYARHNPARGIKLPDRPPARVLPILTSEELVRLLAALPDRYRTMVWLACMTTIRVGELLALRWDSVDWENGFLAVREAVYRGDVSTPKNGRERVEALLPEWLDHLREFKRQFAPDAERHEWMFLNTKGTGPFDPTNLMDRIIGPAARKCGIGKVSWHMFRRWGGTTMHRRGVPPKVAQECMGHADISTTMRYYVGVPRQSHELAARALHDELAEAGEGLVSVGIGGILVARPPVAVRKSRKTKQRAASSTGRASDS